MKISNVSNLRFLMLPLAMLLTFFTYGQSVVVVLNKEVGKDQRSDISNQECYKIQLKNKSSKAVGLAGQNYRLYYNSDAVILDESNIQNYLPKSYTAMNLVQHVYDVNATGFGVLPFESHLGFINLATDYKLSSGMPAMIGTGETVDIAKMCFNITDASKDGELIWAREDLTQTYATAFVEIASVQGNRLKKMYIDDLVVTGTRALIWQKESVANLDFFPNPFKDQLEIKFNYALTDNAELEVLDIFGRLLQSKELNIGEDRAIIKGDDLPAGALVIKIKQQNGDIATFKAMKTK